jgi:hypothetical protein
MPENTGCSRVRRLVRWTAKWMAYDLNRKPFIGQGCKLGDLNFVRS